MIDPSRLKKGLPVLVDGRVKGKVRGCYLSPEGLVVRVQTQADAIVDQNVLLENLEEVKADEQPQG